MRKTKADLCKIRRISDGKLCTAFVQMPILLALYQVIMRVPAYVSGVKEVFTELSSQILAAGGSDFMQELAKNGAMSAYVGKDFAQQNTIIDVLYRLQETGKATWQMLADHFPEMDSLIDTTHASINHMNDFILIQYFELTDEYDQGWYFHWCISDGTWSNSCTGACCFDSVAQL